VEIQKSSASVSVEDVEMSAGAVGVSSASTISQGMDYVCITFFKMRPDQKKCPYRTSESRTAEVRAALAKRKYIYRK